MIIVNRAYIQKIFKEVQESNDIWNAIEARLDETKGGESFQEDDELCKYIAAFINLVNNN